MALSKDKLQELLTRRLHLPDAEFQLRKVGTRWVGNIISSTFKGKRELPRMEMMWDVLDAELEPAARRQVGMLLTYTPEEWHIGDEHPAPRLKNTRARARTARSYRPKSQV